MFTVQNIVFNFSSLPEHLFYQISGRDFIHSRTDDSLTINSKKEYQTKVNFLGIFNAFPAEHFLKHTHAKNVYLKLQFSGDVSEIKVYKTTQWSTEVAYESANFEGNEILVGPLSLELGVRRFHFSLATRGNVVLNKGEWLVDADIVTPKTVDIGITTFKKEKYVTSNVNMLLQYKPLENFNFRTIVVDNGSTLTESDFVSSDKLLLIPQANLGGTGGFMRGLMEAHNHNSDYILFMDDDILLAPEVVFRAIAIAQIAKPKKAFGGMMLHFTKKDKIHEQGGRLPWKVNDFFRAINDGDYLNELENNPKYNELYAEGHPDFSGWWFYMAEVKETPILPNFFFKWDDICSSLYLQKNGIKLSVFPTIFVWHEDFSIKRHLFMTDYLSMRNETFAFAFLDTPKDKMKVAFKKTYALIIRDILLWDYSRAKIRLKALEDTLNYKEILSTDFVLSGNGDYPVKLGREFTPKLQEIPDNVDIYFEQERNKYPRGISSKRLFKLLLGSLKLVSPFKKDSLKNGKVPLLSMHNGNFPIVYGYKEYFLYNADGNVGYFCKYSFKETIDLLLSLRKLMKKVENEYPNIVSYMTSEKFDETYWNTIFNAENQK